MPANYLDEYELEESPKLMHESTINLGLEIKFAEWLYRVRNGAYFPTFYFPSTFAGPDIVFCLKSRTSTRRILCAFQVRCNSYPFLKMLIILPRLKRELHAVARMRSSLFVHWIRNYGFGRRGILERRPPKNWKSGNLPQQS